MTLLERYDADKSGTIDGTDPLTGPAMVGEALTGLVVDPDGSVTDQSWQWMKAKSEAIRAINDYLSGEGADAISKDEAIQVINLYLFA
jgi:hypothetical protein